MRPGQVRRPQVPDLGGFDPNRPGRYDVTYAADRTSTVTRAVTVGGENGGDRKGVQMDRFSELAADWDAQPGRRERAAEVAEAIRRALPLRGGNALEIGGGTGLLSRSLADVLGPVTVSDVAPGMVAAAAAAVAQRPAWTAIRYDIEHDPVLSERYNLALCMLALHHMGDVPAVLGTMFELVEPGGHVALVDLDRDEEGGFHRHVHDFDGHHGFDRRTVEEWLSAAGFVGGATTTAASETKIVDGVEKHFPLFLATAARP